MTRLLVVKTRDGMQFTGADAKEVVRQMKYTEWTAPDAKRDYMDEVLVRVYSMTNVTPTPPVAPPLRAEKFLSHLQRVGLLRLGWMDDDDDE